VESGNLFGVADGMGGHQAGEVASAMALSVIQQYIEDNLGLLTGEQMVENALAAANASVFAKASSSAKFRSMGTTVTLLYREGRTAFIGHVGDSRAYLFRNGALKQLTADHSLVARLVEEGEITEEEARRHPQRNIILKALGLERQVDADVVAVEILPGDAFLLATDGLTGLVDDGAIEAAFRAAREPTAIVRRLIDEALDAGGADNVSAVVARFDEASATMPAVETEPRGVVDAEEEGAPGACDGAAAPRARRFGRGWIALTVGLILLVGACVSVGFYFYNRSYFVGARDGELVLYKGFPFWGLASVQKKTGVDVKLLTAANQQKVTGNMEVESREGALDTLAALEREARNYTLVPNVVGKMYGQAKKLLENAGLHSDEPPELISSENARIGTVFQQSPEAFSRAGRGTGVKLKVVSSRTTRGV